MEILDIALAKLVPSPLNPRRSFNPHKLEELQASIAANGIIDPLVVRKKGSKLEIICGERRHKAATALKLETVPVVVRTLDDTTAIELALVENIQDEDLHPLDEAGAYETLLKSKTLDQVGERVGRSPSHIFRTIQLLKLAPPAKKAFSEDRITIRHAERLTRVPKAKQAAALEECFAPLFRSDQSEPAPVARLDTWIARHVNEDLDEGAVTHVFPNLLEEAEGDHPEDVVPTLIKLSESHHASSDLETRKHGLVNAGSWCEIRGSKGRCKNMRQGVVVHGGPVRVLLVCATKGCPKHRPPKKRATAAGGGKTTAPKKPQWEVEQERRERERKAWDALQPKLLAAFVAHVTDLRITPALVEEAVGWQLRNCREVIGTKKITDANMGQFMAVAVLFGNHIYDQAAFTKSAKPFGFNPGKTIAAHKSELAAAAKAAKKTKPTAKKKAAKKKTAKRTT